MRYFSPKLCAVVIACGIVTAIGAGAVLRERDSNGPAIALPPESVIETPRPPSQSSLPTCQSATATNCDRSSLAASEGTHGSAGCVGRGTALLGASPIDIDEIAYIQPMGLMTGGHVTPIDHGYFYIKGAMQEPHHQAVVRAPLAGLITFADRSVRHGPDGDYDDYSLTIEATCTFRIHFSNLVKLAGSLADAVGQLQAGARSTPNLQVAEGEVIGYTGLPTANGIDVSIENDELTLPGFVNPQDYAPDDTGKLHMADLFDYTTEPLKSQLLALDMRAASPRWGKIDYDVDGRLVGNWFRQGSGGFQGIQHGGDGYWDGHLAVVSDANDPHQLDVSFGNYAGQPKQFAVIGNAPDPAEVTQTTGLVTYQLGQIVTYSGDTGAVWDSVSYLPNIRTRAGDAVAGTVLFQLVGPRLLQVEIFPGRSAGDVDGFDSGALLYER